MEFSEEQMEQLKQIVEQVIARGRGDYKDFDERINGSFERGKLGAGFVYNVMPDAGDDAVHLAYALASNDELCDFIDSLGSVEEAKAFIANHKEEILDSIDLDNTTMERWVKARERQSKRKAEGSDLNMSEKDQWFAKRNHEERERMRRR